MIRAIVKLLPIALLVYSFRSGTASAQDAVDRVKNWAAAAMATIDLNGIGSALEAEYALSGRYPASLEPFIRQTLKSATSDLTRDRWGRPYRFHVEGTRFEIVSAGPDGEFGTADDLVERGVGHYSG